MHFGLKNIVFILYFLATIGFFAYTCRKIFSYFKLTKPTDRFDNTFARLMWALKEAIGQTKMFKFSFAGTLHALLFWGFMIITLGTAEMVLDGFLGTERVLKVLGPLYSGITATGEIFAGIIIFACFIFLGRRYIAPPKRFVSAEMKPKSRMDATFILALILILMFSLIGMNMGYIAAFAGDESFAGAYPLSNFLIGITSFAPTTEKAAFIFELNWWIHIALVLLFLNILPYSKHFHVLLSIPNVFFKKLEVFGQLPNMPAITHEVKIAMGMAEPDPNVAPPSSFGVKDVEDVTWKNLMDSYTCTECGRCTANCPANLTGKKLSPRKLFIDLRARMAEKGPQLVANKDFSDNKTLFDRIDPEELWACTTCAACMEECPVDIEHIPFILDMRRYLVMEQSKAPAALNSMFANIENNGAPWAMPASSRFDWANDIQTEGN